jgi:broad-specificity NMP kinase
MKSPNVLITGTPGTGKTTTAQMLAAALNYEHIEISNIVKVHNLHEGFNTEFQSYILDADKVIDYLEPIIAKGGIIIDHHGSDLFPPSWFELVVVLQCSQTEVLYDRLAARGYSEQKITENMECEIMRVCLDEALDSFDEDQVLVLESCSLDDMERNVEKLEEWIDDFCRTSSN